MSMRIPINRASIVVAIAVAIFAGGCASTKEQPETSEEYQSRTAKTPTYKCPAGHVLMCEARKTGRIRFGRIGNQDLETCACEPYQGMPTQSPVPGIQ